MYFPLRKYMPDLRTASCGRATAPTRWDRGPSATGRVGGLSPRLAREVGDDEQGRKRAAPTPDTGSLRGDLHAFAQAVTANLTSPIALALLRTYVSEAGRSAGIELVARAFWDERFALATTMVRRAIGRGELPPEADAELMIETLVAPLFLRTLVTAKPITSAYVDRIVDAVLAAHGA
jgi:hypothetical protein